MSPFLTHYEKVVVVKDETIMLFKPGFLIVFKGEDPRFIIVHKILCTNNKLIHSTEEQRPLVVTQGDVIVVYDEIEDILKNVMYYQCFVTKNNPSDLISVWIHQDKLKDLYLKEKNV